MKKLKVLALALVCAVFSPAKADEGMWLLQLMQEQNLADRMKAQGLKMDIMDIYNPDQITLKDAVGIFGRGCTGEIISPNGLILTNHHCGYDAIQQPDRWILGKKLPGRASYTGINLQIRRPYCGCNGKSKRRHP